MNPRTSYEPVDGLANRCLGPLDYPSEQHHSTVPFDDGQLLGVLFWDCSAVAEGAGFEPAEPCSSPVFKTGGFVRSPTPPRGIISTCRRGDHPSGFLMIPPPSRRSPWYRAAICPGVTALCDFSKCSEKLSAENRLYAAETLGER